MGKKRWLQMIGLLMSMSMLTGCWDRMEINNRSVLLEFAIDKNDDYTYDVSEPRSEQKKYRFTYSIPDFGKLSGTESLAKDAETSIVVESPTIACSINDVEMRSKDTITFSHVKALFLGESLMQDKELFQQALDSISRDMLLARNVPILAVNGDATLTSEVENAEQPVLGLYILDFFNNKERPISFFKKQLLGNFIREIEDTGITTLPIFHIDNVEEAKAEEEAAAEEAEGEGEDKKPENTMGMESGQKEDEGGGEDGGAKDTKKDEINISGAAVIKDYELVGYITKEEVMSQLYIEGKIRNAPVLSTYMGGPVTYTIMEQQSDISFQDTEEGPICFVEIKTKGNIGEYLDQTGEELISTESTEDIKIQIANEIVEQIKVGIQKSKEMNVDFLGLGREMYRKESKMWKQYKAAWQAGIYRDMPIEIGVDVDIESAGIQE